jgi:catechol 2,3-dioxygenase-like lactoylglutathione lyase family enzyme
MVRDPLEALRLPIVPVEPRPAFAEALLRRLRGEAAARDSASVRYFVSDLGRAVAFYRDQLGFQEELRPGGGFAMLYRGDLRLLLSTPGGTHQLPDGTLPEPGGWNRIALRVADIEAIVEALRAAGVRFRTGIVENPAVRNALVEDPSGNPVELFEPLALYHERRV